MEEERLGGGETMHIGLYAKFTQHGELKKRLLGTGDRPLVEHTERDRYWGDSGDGRGENHLGNLLMKLRKELFEEEKDRSNKEGETVRRRKNRSLPELICILCTCIYVYINV